MANIYPTTTTTVSPFSEYNSNVVNRLTRMISLGENCIKGTHSCEVEIDPSSPTTGLLISTGTFFKDDCLHSIDSEFEVDMSDEDFYADDSGGYWNEAGYYLIVADYTYVKSKPAPAVAIQIIMPSQYVLLTTRYLFLKAVLVQFNGASFEIDSVYDYLPTDPTIKREYAKTYIGSEITLPVYDNDVDEGRIIYNRDTGDIYVGQYNDWVKINSDLKIWMDTNACTVSQLGYIKNDGKVYPAIATAENTQSCCVVLKVGDVADNTGQVLLYGLVENVSVETGITITMGDLCYLSASEAGKITNVAPLSYTNYVGRAVTTSTPGGTLTLWYQHELGGMGSSGGGGSSRNISQTTHGFSIGHVLRYNSGTSSYVKAQSDSESNSNVVGIVSNSISANAFTLLTHGYISGLSGLTPGSVYYLSDVTAGLLTLTEPTTITSYSKPLLIAITTTTGYFFNFRGLSVGQTTIPLPIAVGGTNSITGAPLVPQAGSTGQALTKASNTNYDTTWATLNEMKSGGSTGQVLTKASNTDYDTSWTTISVSGTLPPAGSTGQALKKASNTDYDTTWETLNEMKSGGTTGQALTKASNTDYDTTWATISVPDSVPTGALFQYIGSSAPSGYLLCDGASYLRASYASLFAVIGTTYGSADGNSFNVPDFRGRIAMGAGTGTGGGASGNGAPTGGSALTARSAGAWGGTEAHTLIEAELPSTAGTHSHTIQPTGGGSIEMVTGSGLVAGIHYTSDSALFNGLQTSSDSVISGSDSPHTNIQPFVVTNFIIKI